MKAAYLSVQTHDAHPALTRILVSDEEPHPIGGIGTLETASAKTRFVARFNDIDAALMHTHGLLRRRLVDLDARLYRTPLVNAIAAVESLDLRHQTLYLDPDLKPSEREEISRRVEMLQRRRQRSNRCFEILGWIGLALLLLNFLTQYRFLT